MIKEESSLKLSTRSQAILELVLAGILWGFGFIATVWALKTLSVSAVIFYRFFAAFLVGILILIIAKVPLKAMWFEAKLSLIPGVALYLLLLFQTLGLETTTATNSGFITTLYIIWVPLFRYFYHREQMGKIYWLAVGIALLGTLFILNWKSFDWQHLNLGDGLTLIASFLAAYHIILVGQRAPHSKNDFAFNIFQSLWVSLPCLLLLLPAFTDGTFFGLNIRGNWRLQDLDNLGWWGLAALTFGSSLIAFFLQVRAQKTLSPSTASLLFLLESPAACLFAFWLLGERLSPLQMTGAFLIMLACLMISLPKKSTT